MEQGKQIEKKFLEAYEEYADKIFRHCFFRTRDREKAKELCQETFTKAWAYLRNGNEVEYMGALLYKIATNLVIDASRANRETASLEVLFEQGFEPSTDSGDPLFAADARQIIAIVDKLDKDDKEIIIMRYMEDLPVKDIAKTIGLSQVNVSVRIHRALKKLRTLVESKRVSEKNG